MRCTTRDEVCARPVPPSAPRAAPAGPGRGKGTYTYFYCLGQKDRRNGTGCQERYVVADHLEAEVEDLYGRIEVPDGWADGLRQAIADEVATHHEDTTAERKLLAHRHERLDAERFKLMEAYYASAIDVTM